MYKVFMYRCTQCEVPLPLTTLFCPYCHNTIFETIYCMIEYDSDLVKNKLKSIIEKQMREYQSDKTSSKSPPTKISNAYVNKIDDKDVMIFEFEDGNKSIIPMDIDEKILPIEEDEDVPKDDIDKT